METTIAFILIFGSLVFFHELGHFLFAKRAGILVREFAIGVGPKIIGIKRGETLYTLRLIPAGGYVKMAGEDMDTLELKPGFRVTVKLDDENQVVRLTLNQKSLGQDEQFLQVERADLNEKLFIEGYDEDNEFVRFSIKETAIIVENGTEINLAPLNRQFNSKTLPQRFMTIFAGPLFNFILAFFIFLLIGVIQGVPTQEPVITEVVDGGPAAISGLQQGDVVTEIDGENIGSWDEMASIIQANPEKEMSFTVQRGGNTEQLSITPNAVQQGENTVGQIGILYQSPLEKNPVKAVQYGAEETVSWTVKIGQLLGKLVTGQFTIDALSGPVGIYKATEEVAQYGFINLLHWAAILSVNLGIMNLLPLPALDGGRILFFIAEALRGKPVDRQKEGLVHFVGIVLLMVLMVVVTWNDIQRFFL